MVRTISADELLNPPDPEGNPYWAAFEVESGSVGTWSDYAETADAFVGAVIARAQLGAGRIAKLTQMHLEERTDPFHTTPIRVTRYNRLLERSRKIVDILVPPTTQIEQLVTPAQVFLALVDALGLAGGKRASRDTILFVADVARAAQQLQGQAEPPNQGYTSKEVCQMLRRSRQTLSQTGVLEHLAQQQPFGPKHPLYDMRDVGRWMRALMRHDALVALGRRPSNAPLVGAIHIAQTFDRTCPRCAGWAMADPEEDADILAEAEKAGVWPQRVWCPECGIVEIRTADG